VTQIEPDRIDVYHYLLYLRYGTTTTTTASV